MTYLVEVEGALAEVVPDGLRLRPLLGDEAGVATVQRLGAVFVQLRVKGKRFAFNQWSTERVSAETKREQFLRTNFGRKQKEPKGDISAETGHFGQK